MSQETVHVTMPKGDMGYDQYTFPYTIAVETAFFFLLSFSTRKHTTMACRTILMKFFEWNSKSPTLPFGVVLSSALFRQPVSK